MMFNMYSDYQNGGTSSWGNGNVLGHEFGHMFSLAHSFCGGLLPDMCQKELQCNGSFSGGKWCDNITSDCTCGNNVMSYSMISDYFSPLQMAQMNLTLLTGSISKYLKVENEQSEPPINQTTTWDKSRICYGDVIIGSGATLTIKCKTIMANNARIVVKNGARLIVDGALITTKGPTKTVCNGTENKERWQGIEVWGNTTFTAPVPNDLFSDTHTLVSTEPGIVILKNNAVIENAQVGIFAQQRGTAWTTQQQHFGGLVSANAVEFRNCRKAAEFISDKPIFNISVFKDVTVNQTYLGTTLANPVKTYEGITSWQVSGDASIVQFEHCTFNNLDRGIAYGNATTTIAKCTFDKNKYAVDLGMQSPMAGAQTTIGGAEAAKNTFRYCDYSVYAKAYGLLVVNNNLFEDCNQCVTIEGTSSIFKIEENKFKNTDANQAPVSLTSIGLFQTGSGSNNIIKCNEWINSGAQNNLPLAHDGIFVGGTNLGAHIEQNKFGCWYDIRLDKLGGVNGELPQQGASSLSAWDKFSPYVLATNCNPPCPTEHKADIFTPDPKLGVTTKFTYFHPSGTCNVSQNIPRKPIEGTCAVTTGGFLFSNKQETIGSLPPQCSFGPLCGNASFLRSASTNRGGHL